MSSRDGVDPNRQPETVSDQRRAAFDPIDELARPLSQRLWLTYRDEPTAPRLIFADKRSGIRRVSEQEARVLACQLLENEGRNYSVETPTAETYQQSGTYALSARADLTVHGSRRSKDRLLNVEFKAGVPSVEVFRKDLEKLTRENVAGLWFHTLEKASPRTLSSLATHLLEAWTLLLDYGVVATHDIHFAVCVLQPSILFSTRLTLGDGLTARLDRAFTGALAEWELSGPDASAWPPNKNPPASKRSSRRERRGHEKWLISCPSIADTLLHFDRQGQSYRLREFSTNADGDSSCRTFIASHPDTGAMLTTTEEFLEVLAPEYVLDVYADKTPVSDFRYWASVIADQVAQRHPGLPR